MGGLTRSYVMRPTLREYKKLRLRLKEQVWQNMVRFGFSYSKESMIHVFVDGLNVQIRNLVRQKYEGFPDTTLTRLAEYARDMHQNIDGTRYGDEQEPSDKERPRGGRGGRNRGLDEKEDSGRTTLLLFTENKRPSFRSATSYSSPAQPVNSTQLYRAPMNPKLLTTPTAITVSYTHLTLPTILLV